MKKVVSLIGAVVLAVVSLQTFSQNYLTFNALEKSAIAIVNNGSSAPDVQYSFDGTTWQSFVPGKLVQIAAYQTMYVKGDNAAGFSSSANDYTSFVMQGKISASGSVMSLIDQIGESTVIPCNGCFTNLFNGCEVLGSAPELPATTLTEKCYYMMFMGCNQLTVAPDLPAKELKKECYLGMFFNTNLQKMTVGFSDWNVDGNATYSLSYNIFDCLQGVIHCPVDLEIKRSDENGGHYIPKYWLVNPHKVTVADDSKDFVTVTQSAFAEHYPKIETPYSVDRTVSVFTENEKELANTARDCDYMSDEEKEMVRLLNLVRMDGVKFTNEFLSDLVGSTNEYKSSLIEDLKNVKDLPLLYPNKNLYDAALYHNKEMAELNSLQHESADGSDPGVRVRKFYDWASITENIAYGIAPESALKLLTGYLIDEASISSEKYGHRYNIIRSDKCTRIGFSVYYDAVNKKYWDTQDFTDGNDDFAWEYKNSYSQEETVEFTLADRSADGISLEKVLLNGVEIPVSDYKGSFAIKDFTTDVVITAVYSDESNQQGGGNEGGGGEGGEEIIDACADLQGNVAVFAYPNPSKSFADVVITVEGIVDSTRLSLSIFDASGHIVKTIDSVAQQNTVQLPVGVYTGVVSDGGFKKSVRIVVE